MRDPDLVQRAERAAAALERAWERWRTAHGFDIDLLPQVSSYVGYSLEEPWGQPRVVFGVAADEAELLAAVLNGDEGSSRAGSRVPADWRRAVGGQQPDWAVGNSEPGFPQRAAVEPRFPEPAAVEPGFPEPAAVEPGLAAQVMVEPGVLEPGTLERATVRPGTVDPAMPESGPVESGRAAPGTRAPGMRAPATGAPDGAEPRAGRSGPPVPSQRTGAERRDTPAPGSRGGARPGRSRARSAPAPAKHVADRADPDASSASSAGGTPERLAAGQVHVAQAPVIPRPAH